MSQPDPYRTLQVHPEADVEIIQVAYRKLAQRYHPDVAALPDAGLRMAELNAARDLLLDPARRAAYDQSLAAAAAMASSGASASEPAAHRSARHAPRAAPTAGSAPDNSSGSILNFGRYAGWSLGEIASHDIEYVEWLDRMPIGRPHRAELDAILRAAGRRGARQAREQPRGLFRRR